MASFKWVNTALGNIKSAITGTYRKLGPDHAHERARDPSLLPGTANRRRSVEGSK